MSSHNFTAGTPQNRQQVPLTMEEIARRAPSALATLPYDAMSGKYTYVPTINIIEGMIKAGFQPFSASQSLTRIADKKAFTKHMLRFRHADMGPLVVGDVVPEVVLINSHDGACAFRLIAGLYRRGFDRELVGRVRRAPPRRDRRRAWHSRREAGRGATWFVAGGRMERQCRENAVNVCAECGNARCDEHSDLGFEERDGRGLCEECLPDNSTFQG